MTVPLSPNTQAILLLTAPLIVGRNPANPDLLGSGEYNRLAQHMRSIGAEPAGLLAAGSIDVLKSCEPLLDPERLRRLLGRGLLLSQAVESWRARAIWVVSRSDVEYPQRLKVRLRGGSPALLYGCGDLGLLGRGGLAVVGSRHVDDALIDYTVEIGRLVAEAGETIVSGGAKGIDQAAMRGALEAGGAACGVLADSLERQAMTREHRNMVMDGRLTLVSPYDPKAGFNVGHAMQRNKAVYALADASLVVSSDVAKGGTWAGAIEQLEKLRLVPVYVRATGEPTPGLDALRSKGALSWPEPFDVDTVRAILADRDAATLQTELTFGPETAPACPRQDDPIADRTSEQEGDDVPARARVRPVRDFDPPRAATGPEATPADALFAGAEQAIRTVLIRPMKDTEVAEALRILPVQARSWLNSLADSGVLERRKRPTSYALKDQLPLG